MSDNRRNRDVMSPIKVGREDNIRIEKVSSK